MAFTKKKTEEEKERERQEREAQKRSSGPSQRSSSTHTGTSSRVRNSAVLGGYQTVSDSSRRNIASSQKTSSATLQKPQERRQIPSLHSTSTHDEDTRTRQNVQNTTRSFSAGKELKPIGSESSSNVDKWIQSDYKLSKEEVKQAKEITSKFYKEHPEFNSSNTMAKVDPRSDLAKEAIKMATLRNKTSLTGQIGSGLMDTVKLASNAILGAGKAVARDEETRQAIDELGSFFDASKANAQRQNGLAYGIGKTAGKMAQYMATNPVFDRAAESLGATTAAGKFLTNQLGQNAQDLALDTIPSLIDYARDGSISAEERKDLAKNIGMNVAGNLAIPAIGAAGKGIVSALRANGMPDIAKAASNVNIDDLLKNQDEVADSLKGTENPIPNITDFPTEEVKGFGSNRYGFSDRPDALNVAPLKEKVSTLPDGPLKNQLNNLISESASTYANGNTSNIDDVLDAAFGEEGWKQTVHAAGGDIDFNALRDRVDTIKNEALKQEYNGIINASEEAVRMGRVNDAREALDTVFNDENWNIAMGRAADSTNRVLDLGLSKFASDSKGYAKAVEKTNAFEEALQKYRNGEITKKELQQAHNDAKYAMRDLSGEIKDAAYKADPEAKATVKEAKAKIREIKRSLGVRVGDKYEITISKKDLANFRTRKGEKLNTILNRLNSSVSAADVKFKIAGKGEASVHLSQDNYNRLVEAHNIIKQAKNKDSGLGNYWETLRGAYDEAVMEVGDAASAAKAMDDTDLANVPNDDAVQTIGEMVAREEAQQLPALRREQALQEQIPAVTDLSTSGTSETIPSINDVNRNIDNINESVNGGTGRTDIPGMEDGARRTKTSQAYTNTGQFGGGWNEAEYKAYTDAQNYQYETVSEKESVERAWQTIREEGAENAKERLLNTDNLSGSDLDALMSLWRVQVSNARAAEALGEDATEMWKESNRIFKKIQTESTHNAQALQALAKWSRNTPEGMLARADAIINGRTGGTDAASASMENIYKKYFKDKGKIELSEEFQKNFLDLADKYQNASGREREELMGKMGKLINDQIPVNLPEKIKTYLMDSMLGNFRTLITRNAGGNIGFNAVEQTAERPLAALIDSIIGTKTGRRTQAGLSREALSDYMSGFGKGLSDEWADFKTTLSGGAGSSIHTARSGESTLEEAIANNRQVFSSFIGDKADQLVKHGLSVGDRPFYEAVYKETLGDYNRMYKAGQMGDDIQSLSEEEFKGYAEAAAKMNALAACYQDDSALAKGFMDLRKGVAGLSKGVTGVDILSQFAMPFVKTPANIISRSIEYSPLGFIKNAVNTGRDMAANAAREGGVGGLAGLNAAQQNRLANETARNILGTGLFAGGMAAAKSGLISGGFSDDKDEKEIQKANGVQEYALHTGDDYRSIDWIPVLGNNLVASAAFQEAMANNDGNRLEQLGSGLTAGLESQFDSSMLQGLQRLFGNDSYQRDAGIVENVKNVVMSGMSQAIPSIIRQAAAFDDPYKRQLTGADKMDYYINNIAYGIPGLRRALEPKLNNQGEVIEQNAGRNRLQKALDNFILPYTTTTEQHNPLDDEAMRLSQSIGSNIGFVTTPSRSDITTDTYNPSDAEFTNYKRDAGELKKEIGEGLLQSDFYQQLNDTDKAETLQDVYSAAKAIAKEPYTGVDPDDRYAKVYKADGLEGILSYINANINSKKINFDKDGNATGLSQANALGKFNALSSTGMSAEEQGNVYYNSLSASEQEKLSDFYNANGDAGMYQLIRGKALANEDGTGAIKIQEVLDYATSFPDVSEAVVNQLGSAASGTFRKEGDVWNYYDKNGKLKNVGEKKQYNYKAPGVDYGEATTQNISGATTSNTLTVNAASAEDYAAKRAAMEPDYVGNVDINHRPIVINDDGSYSTTETSFQEKKVGDGYRIAHFTPIQNDGSFIPDDELNQYIDDVLNAPDPMAYDKAHKGIVYKVDTTLEDGQKITDANLNKAFDEADAWDVEMHERQDRMYADEAKAKLAGNQSADAGFQLSSEAKASARYQKYNQLTDTLPDYKISDKDYDDMYHAIDADSNDSIKKAEVVAYLDSRDDLDAKEKAALFSVFGNSNWNNPYAGGATKAGGSGSGKKKGRSSGSGKGSSKKGKKIAFQKYSGMTIPSLQKLDSGRASLRSLSSGGASVPGLNLSSINLGSSGGGGGSIPSIASLMSRYRNLYG